MKKCLFAAALALGLITNLTAGQIATWNFSWTDPTNGPESASLSLNLTVTATPGTYNIVSITGLFNGSSDVSGPNGNGGADNVFYDMSMFSTASDANGIGFSVSGTNYNVYNSDFYGTPRDYYNLGLTAESTSFSASAPESSSFALFGVGAFGISLVWYARRSRRAAKTTW
jgi:hypothetical protein